MSIASYKRNESKRVTGKWLPTCLPAAMEQISPFYGYKPGVYKEYVKFIEWYSKHPIRDRDYLAQECEAAIEKLIHPLGGLTLQDVRISRATTVTGFLRVVRPLLREGFGVVVDVTRNHGSAHSVGLLPVGQEDGHVTLVSTHIHKYLQGIVDLRLVGEHLSVPDYTYVQDEHPINNANIIAFPIAS